jgi:pimeloyl-ACP methyl ester carboxylesterase
MAGFEPTVHSSARMTAPVSNRTSDLQTRRRFLLAASATALGVSGAPWTAPTQTRAEWRLPIRGRVAVLQTQYGSVAYFVPSEPQRLLVLAHGYPWPDGWLFGPFLVAYVRRAVGRWVSFAESNAAIVIAPAMGAGDFSGYREMAGRRIDADEFLNRLVDASAAPLIRGFDGRFALHGHSAGGQFAARYLVVHPTRLTQAILSAPSTYPFPDPSVPWPNGMAPGVRGTLGGNRAGSSFSPNPRGWILAASQLPVTVLVGSRDTDPRPSSPTQHGRTRIDRATAWVSAMKRLAEANGKTPTVKLMIVPDLDHDEAAMAIPAQSVLSGSRAR